MAINRSMLFNGTSDIIDYGTSTPSYFPTSAITVLTLIKVNGTHENNTGYITTLGTDGTSLGMRLFMVQGAGSSDNIIFGFDSATSDYPLRRSSVSSFTSSDNGKWHYIATTHTGGITASDIKIYLGRNCTSLVETGYSETTNGTGSFSMGTGFKFIIGNRGDNIRTFNGNIAFVAMWNRVLSLGELRLAQEFGPETISNGLVFLCVEGVDIIRGFTPSTATYTKSTPPSVNYDELTFSYESENGIVPPTPTDGSLIVLPVQSSQNISPIISVTSLSNGEHAGISYNINHSSLISSGSVPTTVLLLLLKKNNSIASAYEQFYSHDSAANRGLRIGYDRALNTIYTGLTSSTAGSPTINYNNPFAGGNLALNTWIFIAVTFKNSVTGSDIKMYASTRGIYEPLRKLTSVYSASNGTGSVSPGTESLIIGNRTGNDREHYGYVGMAARWSRELSYDELIDVQFNGPFYSSAGLMHVFINSKELILPELGGPTIDGTSQSVNINIIDNINTNRIYVGPYSPITGPNYKKFNFFFLDYLM